MFVAVKAVDDVCQVQLEVERPFGGRHHFQFFCSLHHVLTLFAIANQVALDVMRAVVVPVFRQHAFHFLRRLEIVVRKHARAGGISPQSNNVAGVHQILISEHVVRARLNIQAGGHPVSQVREKRKVLRIQDAAANLKPVGMRVHETWSDGLAADIKHFGSRGHAASCADALDAVVFDHDVGVL